MTTTKAAEQDTKSVAVKKTRKKKVLKPQPEDKARDVMTFLEEAMEKGVVDDIFIFGYDDFTSAFAKAWLGDIVNEVMFTDPNDTLASRFQKEMSTFRNSLHRVHYVNKTIAVREVIGSVLIVGTERMFDHYFAESDLPGEYDQVIILESF